jgi:ribosomal protection tetracycline resistance protein
LGTLNLGILAHVDAGKTTLTERLLYAAGVIDEIGSVDDGSTQTDFLALERQRGITIKSAVVSFAIDDLTVNLIDTPGHPDFIAEVERVLSVLDGVVLVVSAVEGVQAQTRVLMRTLRRLGIATLIFVNKIDRRGARYEPVLRDIAERLTPAIVPMGTAVGLGGRGASFTPYGDADPGFARRLVDLLTEHDDALLAAYLQDAVAPGRLRAALAAQTGRALVHPVFFGSAVTGSGVDHLTAGIRQLLPGSTGEADGPVSGTVFKVDRGAAGERIAYVRMFSGTLRVRDRLAVRGGEGGGERITGINVFERGGTRPAPSVTAGQIGKLSGLGRIRVGDPIGVPDPAVRTNGSAGPPSSPPGLFAPPSLETVILPARPAQRGALLAALAQLAEQDPLINLRQDDIRQELYVSLYGEVQKEVIAATLASDYGLAVSFQETTTVHVERPIGTGASVEFMDQEGNPFRATLGLRVEPAATGSGVRFRLEVELGSLPLAFVKAVEQTVHQSLRQGVHGWQVVDCAVTMTHSGYVPPPPYGWSKWSSSASDFRHLTPLVLMTALRRAGTAVHEPIHRFYLEIPADTIGTVLPALGRLQALPDAPLVRAASCTLEGRIPAVRVHELRQQLSSLTRGEGVLESTFDHYRPVRGPAPRRPRTDHNPLSRKEYLLRLQGRVGPS